MSKEELIKLANDFTGRFGVEPVSKSVLNTYLCGRCHTYPKRAYDIIEDMVYFGIVKAKKGVIEFV